MNEWSREALHELADRRMRLRPRGRHFNEEAELVGLIGEAEFSKRTGIPLDATDRIEGDGGRDFSFGRISTVDVKAFRKPINLLVEEHTARADFYVLAEVDENDNAHLLGYAPHDEVEAAPLRDFGYGIVSHYIHRERLRPIAPLIEVASFDLDLHLAAQARRRRRQVRPSETSWLCSRCIELGLRPVGVALREGVCGCCWLILWKQERGIPA